MICSDPYRIDCQEEADGGMLAYMYVGWEMLTVSVWIFKCRLCAYWECDHDWEKEPAGPLFLQSHLTRNS